MEIVEGEPCPGFIVCLDEDNTRAMLRNVHKLQAWIDEAYSACGPLPKVDGQQHQAAPQPKPQ